MATRRRNLARVLKDAEKAAAEEARTVAREVAKKAAAMTARAARPSAPVAPLEALQPGKASTRAPWEDEDDTEEGAGLEDLENAHEAPPW